MNAAPSLTHQGAVLGTPHYLSLEANSDPGTVDARADLYALGVLAYSLVTGEEVFRGATVVEVCSHHLHTPVEPPSERLGAPIPAPLEELILSLLEKDPKARPSSATEVAERLRAMDLPPYTREQANAWWRDHAQEVEANRLAARGRTDSDLSRTIAPASRDPKRRRPRGSASTVDVAEVRRLGV